MIKKPRYFLFIGLTILFLLQSVFCYAAELESPGIPGVTKTTLLPDYIKAVFNYAMIFGSGLALLMIVVGAIGWLASAGNPEAIGNAKKRIFGAIFGLVLLLSSYLIMQTINPKITQIELPAVQSFPGVYFTDTDDIKTMSRRAAFRTPDTSKLDQKFHYIYYDCGQNSQWPLLIDVYKRPNFSDMGEHGIVDAFTIKRDCGEFYEANFDFQKSLSFSYQTPGVYLHYGLHLDKCSEVAYRTNAITATGAFATNISSIQRSISGHVGCVEIINDPDHDIEYVVMLYDEENWKGRCLGDILWKKENPIDDKIFEARSISVIKYQADKNKGDGVTFCSKPWKNGGCLKLTREWIREGRNGYLILTKNEEDGAILDNMIFGDWGPNVTQEEKEHCDSFWKNDCRGSLEISGSMKENDNQGAYAVFFFDSRRDYAHCEEFWANVDNWDSTVSLTELKKIIIVPLKR